ncbi:protein disulfide isomerase [Lineolata rhizophorae]|uniref:Protein disulfide-isomerase n=1 Tax=Lineolata rhizophorae TaxID=578093 RepID=A0A6A6P6D7_9PEZI|nr:protein disulfide isomerase [Lineolata rhizophorae]
MRNFGSFALGLLGAAAVAAASDVHELDTETFKPFMQENDLVLAEFFAPWCGHCKALAPEYEEAATTLKEKNIPLIKVDCTAQGSLCQEYGVEGYPTLKVFRGLDNISPYAGMRKAPAIVSYMTKQSLPDVSIVDSNTLEGFKSADKVVMVAYFGADDTASNETYTAVAKELRDDYLFGATNDAALAEAEGISQPGLALYKQFDDGKDVFSGEFTEENIKAFAKVASVPLVGEVGPETYAGYMAAGIPLAYIFAETPEERQTLAAELKPLAVKHKGALNFATIDAKAFGQHGNNLNLEVGKWPAFAIQETVKNQKFPFDQSKTLTAEGVGAFVDDFVAGKLEPSIKSEPIPETQEGPVTVVVAHTYNDIVLDDDKDVMIEYYAPWCGHCKALAPKYEELASIYSSNPSLAAKVVVAKVDATANDVPEEISGFPTIKLFPAGAKSSPVDFIGARTVEELANFIRDNGSHRVDGVAARAEAEAEAADGEQMPEQAAAASEVPKEGEKDEL